MSVTTGKLGIIRLDRDAMIRLRTIVFGRDKYRCVRCGTQVTWMTGELAHIEGRGRGGSDTEQNTETCCGKCHRAEHAPKSVRAKG